MFDLGLAIVPGEFRWVAQRPGLLLKALFSVLVAVPVLASSWPGRSISRGRRRSGSC